MTLDVKAAFGQNLQDRFAIDQHPFLMRLIAGLGKDFGFPAQKRFDPSEKWTSVAVVGKQMDQARKTSDQILQKQTRSIAVADIGCMDQNRQDQALRINQEVSLAPKDFFSRRRSHALCLARDWF
jgi:hypothetical protein